jgi:hypothetical protein
LPRRLYLHVFLPPNTGLQARRTEITVVVDKGLAAWEVFGMPQPSLASSILICHLTLNTQHQSGPFSGDSYIFRQNLIAVHKCGEMSIETFRRVIAAGNARTIAVRSPLLHASHREPRNASARRSPVPLSEAMRYCENPGSLIGGFVASVQPDV